MWITVLENYQDFSEKLKSSEKISLVESDKIFEKDAETYLIDSAFTCSELTIKTLEQGVKYVQS